MQRGLLVGVALCVVSACSAPGVNVTAEIMGADWPLTVPKARVECRAPGQNVVVVVEDGTVYAVNGAAKQQAAAQGWQDVEAIWLSQPDQPALKVGIQPLLERGLARCS